MDTWETHTAKRRFEELLRSAESGEPQFITEDGTPIAVVMGIDAPRRLREPKPSLASFLLTGPTAVGLENDLELPSRGTY